ncbi:MAG TPA: NAD(P)-dependent oxidoreductase [Gammaproteobacteria bacterium]|nr:NAD(P)-dependent oxidoreductase [Gammaproteobacteria bacterium]
MKAIVTGATGFVGQHLVKKLASEGWDVLALGRKLDTGNQLVCKTVKFKAVDIVDYVALNNSFESANVVFHVAALSSVWGEFTDFQRANVDGTENILRCCENYAVKRFIYVSSSSVYFDFKDRLNISEAHKLPDKFVNAYAKSKYLGEQMAMSYLEKGIESVVIRPRGIIGEGDQSIMPRIIRLAEKGVFPLMKSGNTLVDITYVGNVVEALMKCATSENIAGEYFNISNNQPMQVKQLLDRVFQALEMQVRYRKVSHRVVDAIALCLETFAKISNGGEPLITRYSAGLLACSQTLDISHARKLLAYDPVYTLEEGIDRYVQWQSE